MSPYSKFSLARLKVQRKVQADLASREGRNEGRGQLAVQLAREWDDDQRARIRIIAQELGMTELIETIDKAPGR